MPRYKHNFILKDFIELADTLKNIKGTFVLSINDHPDTRKVFSQFIRKKVSLLYTIGSKGPTKANELIYSNYELKEYKEPTLFQTDWDSVNF
jgi:DNA adenine methylase